MTQDDLIDTLIELAGAYCQEKDKPDAIITRQYYRDNSGVPDSVWLRVFGTWTEYKRAALLQPDRQETGLGTQTGKHRAHERYKTLQNSFIDYSDKYQKPSGKRFQTILVCSDVHDTEADPFSVYLFLETCKRIQPDIICIGGDLFDFYEFGSYQKDPRDFDLVGRVNWVHTQFLQPLREACPDSQIDLVCGNHEERLLKHLCDSETQAMRVFLSDFHGFNFQTLLGLDQYEINFICRQDLTAFNKSDQTKERKNNYVIYHNGFLVHHFPQGRHYHVPGCNGHHHRHKVFHDYSPHYGYYEWHQIGCLHKRSAVYCDGQMWGNGFLIAHIDTQPSGNRLASVLHEYIQIDDFAVIGGRWYTREESDTSVNLNVT